jgi:catechol 2,3-dioxygenase-like lactoylglutathione lyase family enzyme
MDLHHVHIFASNIEATIEWWSRHLGAKVLCDANLAGARNVFLAVGTGRLHIYDQAPKDRGRGSKSPICAGYGGVCRPKASHRVMGSASKTAGAMS